MLEAGAKSLTSIQVTVSPTVIALRSSVIRNWTLQL